MDDVGVADVLAEKDSCGRRGHAGPWRERPMLADALVLPELETVEVVDAEAPAGMDEVGLADVLAEEDSCGRRGHAGPWR
jgi:hypothetical protein